MRISCQQTILMKYALFIIFEKAAKFEIVVCCKLEVVLYGLITHKSSQKVCVCDTIAWWTLFWLHLTEWYMF